MQCGSCRISSCFLCLEHPLPFPSGFLCPHSPLSFKILHAQTPAPPIMLHFFALVLVSLPPCLNSTGIHLSRPKCVCFIFISWQWKGGDESVRRQGNPGEKLRMRDRIHLPVLDLQRIADQAVASTTLHKWLGAERLSGVAALLL